MPVKIREEVKGIMGTLESASRDVKRWPKRVCFNCNGTRKIRREVDNGGGWDRMFEYFPCSCKTGYVGGAQPNLTLYFQSEEERNEFKQKITRMRGITWWDEGNVLETIQEKEWQG